MAVATQNFTTGPSTLPDVGVLFYNGCTFSPLYETNVSGRCVKDDAQRTIMYMEYTISVDGYVTLPDGAADINGVMNNLRTMLTAQGGELRYIGRGNDIEVNVPGSKHRDVKWGPTPELLEFQPLGAGRSAKIKWIVKVQIVEQGFDGRDDDDDDGKGGGGHRARGRHNIRGGGGRDIGFGAGGGGGGGGGGVGAGNGLVKPGPSKDF